MTIAFLIQPLYSNLRHLCKYPEDNRQHSEEKSKILSQVVHALSEHRVDPSGVHMLRHGWETAYRFCPVRQVSHLLDLQSCQLGCGGVAAEMIAIVSFPECKFPSWSLGTGLYTTHMPLILLFAPEVVRIIGNKSTSSRLYFPRTRGRYPRVDPFNPLLPSVDSFSCSS